MNFYTNICKFSTVADFLNASSDTNRKFLLSSPSYPQSFCANIIKKKRDAWANLGELTMVKSISKSYTNDRDYYMESLGANYRAILEKFHHYQKIIFRASSKITNFIREAVK